MISKVNGRIPRVESSAFVAPGAMVLGEVILAARSNVWYQCVLRADINRIAIGERTSVQDGVVMHVDHVGPGCQVGCDVLVGHQAVLHSCRVGDRALVGMSAVVLSGAEVGEEAVVAAGSVVPPGAVIPPGAVAMGTPAQVVRQRSEKELRRHMAAVERYQLVMDCHQDHELVVELPVE